MPRPGGSRAGPALEENSNKINGQFGWAPGGRIAGLMSARTSRAAQSNIITPAEVVACGLARQMAHGVMLEVACGRVVDDADAKPADNLASRL